MKTRKLMTPGLALVLACGMVLLVGGCSQRKSRVETSGVTSAPSATERAAAEEEEARRRAEAERRAAQSKAAGEPGAPGTPKVMDEVQAFESEPIFFDFDRSEIQPEYRPVLERKAAFLRARPEYSLRIEGHCDGRGTEEYNLALGEKRAMRVKDYLVDLGVSARRISTLSYGEERPAVRGNDEETWAKNRRAEFRLSK